MCLGCIRLVPRGTGKTGSRLYEIPSLVFRGRAIPVPSSTPEDRRRYFFFDIMSNAEIECEECGQRFEVKPHRADSARFCSRGCSARSQQVQQIEKTCDECGEQFTVKPSREDSARFCSVDCSSQAVGRERRKKPRIIEGEKLWRCTRCDEYLPEDQFYNRSSNHHGLRHNCKSCCTDLNLKTRDPENARDYNREWMRKDRRRNPEKYKKRDRERARKRDYDEKDQARRKLNYAVQAGEIERPEKCPKCGREDLTIHGHHHDYSQPLDVEWMCSRCHGKEHRDS